MIYGYARVSTQGQDLEGQLEELQEAGVLEHNIYREKMSGKTTERPEFKKLLAKVKKGDTIVVSKLDRLARNTREALNAIEPLLDQGVTLRALNLGTIENNHMGRFIVKIMLCIADMERELINERCQTGKARAKKKVGYKEGRPKKVITEYERNIILELEDLTFQEVAEKHGVSISTIFRWKAKIEEESNG
ncbi:MAG: recombinase family protein [Lactococcus lactis]|nr:recombinase family protein [Lactococcus lactis]